MSNLCLGYLRMYSKSFARYLPICACFGLIGIAFIVYDIVGGYTSPEKRWNDSASITTGTILGYDFTNSPTPSSNCALSKCSIFYTYVYKGLLNVTYLGGLFKEFKVCDYFRDLCSDSNLTLYTAKLEEHFPIFSGITCYYQPEDLRDVRLAYKSVVYFGEHTVIGLIIIIPAIIGFVMLLGSLSHYFICYAIRRNYEVIPGESEQSDSSSIDSN